MITEKLCIEIRKTNYNTFSLMCGVMRNRLIRGIDLDVETLGVFVRTSTYIQLLYAMDDKEVTMHMLDYFSDSKWEEFQEAVRVLMMYTKNSFQ